MMPLPLSIAVAAVTILVAPAAAEAADQARDHAAIVRMAGAYKVTFDFRETVPLVAGYVPLPGKVTGGHEVVRAIADTPGFVSLQHLLVVEDGNGRTVVVKHWRQDWTWQPASVLTYAAAGTWRLRAVPPAERAGAWSQTVWQTDDSPRYGGVGRWRYDGGAARWTSDDTRRPLARRDAVRHPPYDHYVGVNHHLLTPTGWAHEQENAKVGVRDGRDTTVVREYVVNSYVADPGFKAMPADEYWTKTRDYWATIRADWAAAIKRDGGVKLAEEADNGSVTGHELMLIADDVASGETTLAAARDEAAALIARSVTR